MRNVILVLLYVFATVVGALPMAHAANHGSASMAIVMTDEKAVDHAHSSGSEQEPHCCEHMVLHCSVAVAIPQNTWATRYFINLKSTRPANNLVGDKANVGVDPGPPRFKS